MASVTIIGGGQYGAWHRHRIVAGGAEVRILAPTVERATSPADELAGDGASVTGAGAQEPLVEEVIVVATPYEAALEVASARRDELAGKVVADITNPVDWAGFDGLVTPAGSSGAEEIAKLATGVRVVKAFNTTFAGTLQAGEVADHQLDVLIAGDDADAKTQVAALGSPGGCGPSTPVLCAGPASSNSWGSCTWRAGGARRRIRQHLKFVTP